MDWFANEGVPHDKNNPLNMQARYGGSVTEADDGGDPTSKADGIQAYPNPNDFVHAFMLEMHNPSYPAILQSLRAGKGLEGRADTRAVASDLRIYSGNGYDSIPAAYCPCCTASYCALQ